MKKKNNIENINNRGPLFPPKRFFFCNKDTMFKMQKNAIIRYIGRYEFLN